MKTVSCGRCTAKIDVPAGMAIGSCLSSLGEKNTYVNASHSLVVDNNDEQGARIVDHFRRTPLTRRK